MQLSHEILFENSHLCSAPEPLNVCCRDSYLKLQSERILRILLKSVLLFKTSISLIPFLQLARQLDLSSLFTFLLQIGLVCPYILNLMRYTCSSKSRRCFRKRIARSNFCGCWDIVRSGGLPISEGWAFSAIGSFEGSSNCLFSSWDVGKHLVWTVLTWSTNNCYRNNFLVEPSMLVLGAHLIIIKNSGWLIK